MPLFDEFVEGATHHAEIARLWIANMMAGGRRRTQMRSRKQQAASALAFDACGDGVFDDNALYSSDLWRRASRRRRNGFPRGGVSGGQKNLVRSSARGGDWILS